MTKFSRYLELPKLVVLLTAYAPQLHSGPDGSAVLAVGGLLLASQALRQLSPAARLPVWVRTVWVFADALLWLMSYRWSGSHNTIIYAGLMLCADAAMIGWARWRGLPHVAAMALLVSFGPWLLSPDAGLRPAIRLGSPLAAGPLFVYAFVYLAGRMAEERDESARARIAAELANTYLREYAAEVEGVAALRERNRIAREVHDTIAHAFTGIIMQMEAVNRLLERDPARAPAAVTAVQQQARHSLNEVRRSVHALRPMDVEESRGLAALRKVTAEFSEATGVVTDLTVLGVPVPLPSAHDLCIYRAVQEGLTNAFRHGRASKVRLQITFHPDQVILRLDDDGLGSGGAVSGGLGIMGIRERAAVLGGSVAAANGPVAGFTVIVTLPLAVAGGHVG